MRDRGRIQFSQHDIAMPESLDQLLPRVAQGDSQAFEQFYRHLSAPVFGLILRVLRDPAQSEEVAQEVFLELWRTAARYNAGQGSVRSWAMMIAHRRAVDRVRMAQSISERDTKAAQVDRARDFDEVTDTVLGNLERQQVRACLDSLTDVQRESVRLAYYQGYTHREVSQLLDCPLGTIKTRLRDGLIRLRDCLGATP
ncbi:ECF RNA polymerase sigma factor SigK [Kibdelosporangium phytohabitans]|uniref:RNA polymerase subunit sigma n=1 Tax=Kibdelosporangium phytohabitans TaxID=860235 RepID=A0A0N9I161_9PSEU|nr:ECF RNA polymerase sigma factor SigK [Kibdelosporangium phytohabitans]ALG12092.1 RNA polymerase subunit sigma [Kibdelosporangium phytohabitans]MBE1463584.1 RNA polymerase sigma-70 factor (ECF subfamily) [Kibdelosporangium phytohabitans]